MLFAKVYHHFRCRWSSSFSNNVHANNIGTQKDLLRHFKKSFDTGIVKKVECFSTGQKNFLMK